jgi:hypothetical protein
MVTKILWLYFDLLAWNVSLSKQDMRFSVTFPWKQLKIQLKLLQERNAEGLGGAATPYQILNYSLVKSLT